MAVQNPLWTVGEDEALISKARVVEPFDAGPFVGREKAPGESAAHPSAVFVWVA